MNYARRPICQLLLLLFVFTACSKKEIEFGNELGETYTKILQVDTVSVNLSTYVMDSFVTSGISNFIAGSYRDSLLGTVKAKPFLQLMPTLGTTLEDDAVFDSLTFVLKPNGYYYGDTTQLQTVAINELASPIEYRYGSYIFNTSSFTENIFPLGSRTTRIYPNRGDSITVRLSDAKGLEFFNKIKQSSSEMQTADAFLDYFKGVAINISSSSPSAVYGFEKTTDSIYMRLHYHTSIPYPEVKYKDFSFYNNLYSNQIVTDRTGTALASLSSGEISSMLTGNRAFTQSGTGVLLKMTFPTLRNILQLDPTVKLLKATLVLKTPSGSYDGKLFLPSSLLMAQTDASNALGAAIYNSTGEYLITASPSYDNLYGAATSYSFEVTPYINTLLTTSGSEANGLFLMQNSPGASGDISRAVINNSAAALNNSQLILSLLTLKN